MVDLVDDERDVGHIGFRRRLPEVGAERLEPTVLLVEQHAPHLAQLTDPAGPFAEESGFVSASDAVDDIGDHLDGGHQAIVRGRLEPATHGGAQISAASTLLVGEVRAR